ncbi:MAG: monovalent cation/H+ antiporter complex subunit F [Rickettsiaceae bacterium]
MIYFCLIFTLLCIVALVLYSLSAKEYFVKILILNNATSITGLLICFLSSFVDNNAYIDIAIIYFILSFIASAAYLRYFILSKK